MGSELVDLGGLWAWMGSGLAPGDTNCGVVRDDDGLTIVDAMLTPADASELLKAVEAFELPVRRLVLTSSHMPWVGGSGVFTLAAVYGTPQVSAHLDQDPNLDTCTRLYPDRSGDLAGISDCTCRRVTHTVSEGAWISATCVVAPLAGELDENLIVQVPESQVVFGGAMLSFGVTPMAGLGDPAAWADSLDTLLDWGTIFVPGQGPIGGREQVEELQAYLRACVDAAGDPGALGEGPWREWPGSEYHRVNIDRAAALAAGDREPQPSMLALLGL